MQHSRSSFIDIQANGQSIGLPGYLHFFQEGQHNYQHFDNTHDFINIEE